MLSGRFSISRRNCDPRQLRNQLLGSLVRRVPAQNDCRWRRLAGEDGEAVENSSHHIFALENPGPFHPVVLICSKLYVSRDLRLARAAGWLSSRKSDITAHGSLVFVLMDFFLYFSLVSVLTSTLTSLAFTRNIDGIQ